MKGVRDLFLRIEERVKGLVEVMEMSERILREEYRKMIEGGLSNPALIEKMVDKAHRYLLDSVVLMERIYKLRKEVSEIDEMVDRIVYLIFQLDQEGRERVGKVMEEEMERIKVEERVGKEVLDKVMEKIMKGGKKRKKRKKGEGKLGLFMFLCRNSEMRSLNLRKEGDEVIVVVELCQEDLEEREKWRKDWGELWWDVVRREDRKGIEVGIELNAIIDREDGHTELIEIG